MRVCVCMYIICNTKKNNYTCITVTQYLSIVLDVNVHYYYISLFLKSNLDSKIHNMFLFAGFSVFFCEVEVSSVHL